MQQLHGIGKHMHQNGSNSFLSGSIVGIQCRLGHFDIPVAELGPDKIIDFFGSQVQFIVIQIPRNFANHRIQS